MSNWTCAVCGKSLTSNQRFLLEGLDWCEHHYREASSLSDPLALVRGDLPTSREPHIDPLRNGVVAQRYAATRSVIVLLKVMAVVTLFGAFAIGAINGDNLGAGVVGIIIVGAVSALVLYAAAEGLQVVIDMEEHQRAIRLHIERSAVTGRQDA
jgi:hypothetical protein